MENIKSSLQQEAVKWLFIAVIALIGAGGVAMAKDKFYTKSEVDVKDQVIKDEMDRSCMEMRSESAIQRSHIMELNKIQNENILDKLNEISTDVKELQRKVQ